MIPGAVAVWKEALFCRKPIGEKAPEVAWGKVVHREWLSKPEVRR